MKKMSNSISKFICFIMFPLVLIAFFADYNFIDTSNYFFRTLLSGNIFYMYSSNWPFYNPLKSEYVFQPFVGIAQNISLFLNLTKFEESIYFAQFIVYLISLYFISKTILNKKNLYEYSIITIFILSPPLVFCFFQPLLTETIFILFVSIFLYTIKNIINKKKFIYFLLFIILISLILLSKRSSIILLLPLNFFLIIFSIKARKKFYIFTFLIGFIFSLIGYLFLVSYTNYSGIGDPLKDPIIFFYLYAGTDYILVYIYLIAFFKIFHDYLVDHNVFVDSLFETSLLLSSFVYFSALVVFGKHSEYQQVICYLLILPFMINLNLNNQFFKRRSFKILTVISFLPIIWIKDFFIILLIFICINFFIFLFEKNLKFVSKKYILNILFSFCLFYLILPGTGMIYHRYIVGKNIEQTILKLKPYEKIIDTPEILIHSGNNLDCNEAVMHNVIFNERLDYYLDQEYKLFKNPINNIDDCKKSLKYFEDYYFPVNNFAFKNYRIKSKKLEPDLIISNYFSNKTDLYNYLSSHSISYDKYKLFEYKYNYVWNTYYSIISRISAFSYKTPVVFFLSPKDY